LRTRYDYGDRLKPVGENSTGHSKVPGDEDEDGEDGEDEDEDEKWSR